MNFEIPCIFIFPEVYLKDENDRARGISRLYGESGGYFPFCGAAALCAAQRFYRKEAAMVSMKTIAQKCCVSTATVSKALSDQKDISEETKARIRKAAQELGYFPNGTARALKTSRSFNIGVLFEEEAGCGLTHEYFSGVLNGLKEQVEKQGYDLTFINTCFDDRKMSYLAHCKYRNFDGVAIVCGDFNSREVIELMNSDLPVVTVDYIHQNCTAVLSDNIGGIEALMRYVYGCGHRRIAYIHGQKTSYVTKDRLASFYNAANVLGLDLPKNYVREAAYMDTRKAQTLTGELLDMEQPPTCILYPDDTALIGGRNEIEKRGMRIPDDISIAGYDGIRMSQLLYPRLTTVRQDTAKIGRQAAIRLICEIEQAKTTQIQQVIIQGKLIPGQSVGHFNRDIC